jgi:hypothetical protein
MVVEAAISGGDRPGRWWGVMRGGAPTISGVEGGASRGGTCARVRRGGGRSAWGGRRSGGARVSAREDGAGWLGRPKTEA